jgi:hypothetical protein
VLQFPFLYQSWISFQIAGWVPENSLSVPINLSYLVDRADGLYSVAQPQETGYANETHENHKREASGVGHQVGYDC